jgi:5-methylcytosine-specific restriction enzyme subunit McrC
VDYATQTPHLSALEHESIPITPVGSDRSLSFAEADVLMQLAESRRGFCERRYRSVQLAQHCGVVNLGTRALEILPKIGPGDNAAHGRGVLLRLLRVSSTHEAFEVLPASQRLERAPLLEIFISLFMDAVTTLLRSGLLRQYAEKGEDLRVVRSRIHLSRQFGVHFNRPDLVASRFDEHTIDNHWNRPVKAALRVIRPWIVSGELHRRWIGLMAAFEEVTDVSPAPGELDRLVFDRQAVRYRPAIDWVRWILSLLSPALRAGENRSPAFLFDMNLVFERAVGNVLRRHLAAAGPGVKIEEQARGLHLARLNGPAGARAFGLRPDIVVHQGKQILLIADAKWKMLKLTHCGHMKPDRADMYQMHAYASAFGVDRLCLIYPAPDGTRAASPTSFVLPDIGGVQPIVTVVCIDVGRNDLPITHGAEPLSLTSVFP